MSLLTTCIQDVIDRLDAIKNNLNDFPLSDCDFIDADFSGADLRYACLKGVKIHASQLNSMVIIPDEE